MANNNNKKAPKVVKNSVIDEGNDSDKSVPQNVAEWKKQRRDEHNQKQSLIAGNYAKAGERIEEHKRIEHEEQLKRVEESKRKNSKDFAE